MFTGEELAAFLAANGSTNASTRKSLLAHHKAAGHVIAARRDLFVAVPPGFAPDGFAVDPFLVAAKAAGDAVVAYHAALQLHGRAYSHTTEIIYLTEKVRGRAFKFQGTTYKPIAPPPALVRAGAQDFSVATLDRQGQSVRVTSLERTLVDALDRPDVGGGSWEEIWRSLETIEFFDVDAVLAYCNLVGNATTTAKVGFFLDQHRESLMLNEPQLAAFRAQRPKSRHYMTLPGGRKERGQLIKDWNLIVPTSVVERAWEEPIS